MKRFVGIILFFFGVHLTMAQELFIHNESASNTPKGVLGIRLFGNSFNEIDVRRNMFALRWMYGVTPKLSFYLTTSFSNHHGANLPRRFNHPQAQWQSNYLLSTTNTKRSHLSTEF